jgi:uncharacterized oxidoreductase
MSFWGSVNNKHTVLITGGASGIGLGIAKRFVRAGHTVIVAGRRLTQLEIAKTEVPGLIAIQADVGTEAGRIALAKKVITEYPEINVLINNAAVVNDFPASTDPANGQHLWDVHRQELEINLHAPMHLSYLFIPHFLTRPQAQIGIVTSAVAFVPLAWKATYSATKAAEHSFALSLRYELKDTQISVVEIIPPAVDTGIGGFKGAPTSVDVYTDDVYEKLVASDDNIGMI